MFYMNLRPLFKQVQERIHLRLSSVDSALPYTTILGIIIGILTGAIVISLRILIEQSQMAFLPDGRIENFEALPLWARFCLPLAGGLLLGLIWQWTSVRYRSVGVVHVMERLAYYQAHLPWRNALQQAIGVCICLISGHSVGREGPSIHLGAASASLFGQSLRLPDNILRVLVACGTAAAISASFNTPLAGIIFSMEVVMMEYSIAGFTPVILAAVVGAMMTRAIYANDATFHINIDLSSLSTHNHQLFNELPYFILLGIIMGLLAALFIHVLQSLIKRSNTIPIWLRFTLASGLTGAVAIFLPQVMGVGYDTVDLALQEGLLWQLMLTLVFAKLFLTASTLSLGLPGGVIGPALFMGAMAGGVLGLVMQMWLGDTASPVALYVMLGMGAMMSATLQAPLAALTALVEMLNNLYVILPAMLVIVVANIVASMPPFSKPSIFVMLMQARGLDYRHDPLAQSLRRIGVSSAMHHRVTTQIKIISRDTAQQLLAESSKWLLIKAHANAAPSHMLIVADLSRYLEKNPDMESINLYELPAQRLQVQPIRLAATLQEAIEVLQQHNIEALYVVQENEIKGVLTKEGIERYYH
jgi:H+/Cl- antiporter ClcA